MGVYISLKILPDRISPDEWATFYDETVQFLKNSDLRLIGPGKERIKLPQGEFERTIYSQTFEQVENGKHFWHICGDLTFYGMGESFHLYRDLNHYQDRYLFVRDADKDPVSAMDLHYDIVENVLREQLHETEHVEGDPPATTGRKQDKYGSLSAMARVFDEKTQGHPFHYYMLGVGMLAEDRFPSSAFVSGDIDRFQAEKARDKIRTILKRDVNLPLCANPDALLKRVMLYYEGIAAVKAFDCLLRDDDPLQDASQMHRIVIRHLGRQVYEHWFLERLKQYETPNKLGAKDIMMEWLNSGEPLETLLRLACIHKDGPLYAPVCTAESLVNLWLTIEPEKRNAWQAFSRPPGAADTVAGRFGAILLDVFLGAKGRNLKVYIPEDVLIQTFGRIFPQEESAVSEMVLRVTRELEETHAQIEKPLAEKLRQVQEEPGVLDGVPILQLADTASITEEQRDWLAHFAYMLSFQLSVIKDGENEIENLFFNDRNYDDLYTQFVLATDKYGPYLTDQAWQWIDDEQDLDLLTTLTMLSLINKSEQKFYHTKKAVMEKKWLCDLVTKLRMDTKEMNKIKIRVDDEAQIKAKQTREKA